MQSATYRRLRVAESDLRGDYIWRAQRRRPGLFFEVQMGIFFTSTKSVVGRPASGGGPPWGRDGCVAIPGSPYGPYSRPRVPI